MNIPATVSVPSTQTAGFIHFNQRSQCRGNRAVVPKHKLLISPTLTLINFLASFSFYAHGTFIRHLTHNNRAINIM